MSVNGKTIYGTDWDMPRNHFGNITITRNSKTIPLPSPAYDDLYELNCGLTISESTNRSGYWYIDSFESDGAGGYYFIWVFKDDKFIKRFIGNSF